MKYLGDDFSKQTNFTPHVGAVTSKIVLNVLSEHGLHSTALQAATSVQEPSWGWWFAQGSTTCWEQFPAAGGTRNHIFLCGGIGHWMWKHLVGLDRTSPGFATVKIAPKIDDTYGPKSTSGEFLSPRGLIKSSWTLGSTFSLDVTLPVGVQAATITVPAPPVPSAQQQLTVTLNGKPIWKEGKFEAQPGCKSGKETKEGPDAVVFECSNGILSFVAKMD